MRIIAGALKGRRLKPPSWEGLRPTSDKLRETLFNILAARIANARVLDLYAGTGAIGIEALSRNAAHVTFVEHDRRAQALIEENLAHCGVAQGYAIIRASVARGLETLRAQPAFDIVVLDPPYAIQHSETVDGVMAVAANVMAPDGVLILEHARKRHAPETAGQLVRSREVLSGDSALAFYKLRGRS